MNVRSLVRFPEALEVDPGVLLDGVVSEMFAGASPTLANCRAGLEVGFDRVG